MKMQDIVVGGVYHDGKMGVREVVSANVHEGVLRYKLLSAKSEHVLDDRTGQYTSQVGCMSTCEIRSFARWAKAAVPAENVQDFINGLAAERIRLSAAQREFLLEMAELQEWSADVAQGTSVCTSDRGPRVQRIIDALKAKGVFSSEPDSLGFPVEFSLTGTGAALVRKALASEPARLMPVSTQLRH